MTNHWSPNPFDLPPASRTSVKEEKSAHDPVDLERTVKTVEASLDLGRILYRIKDRVGLGSRSLCVIASDSVDTVPRETSNRSPSLADAGTLCSNRLLKLRWNMAKLLIEIPSLWLGIVFFPLRASTDPFRSVVASTRRRRILIAMFDSATRTEVIERILAILSPWRIF